MRELQSHFADDLTNEAEWILKGLVDDEQHKALSVSGENVDVQAGIAEIIKLLRFDMLEVPFIMRYRKDLLERARIRPQRVWDVLEKVSRTVSRAASYRVRHGIACGTVQDKEWLDLQGRKNTLQNLWIAHVFHSTQKVCERAQARIRVCVCVSKCSPISISPPPHPQASLGRPLIGVTVWLVPRVRPRCSWGCCWTRRPRS
jgi:hypothetical protein